MKGGRSDPDEARRLSGPLVPRPWPAVRCRSLPTACQRSNGDMRIRGFRMARIEPHITWSTPQRATYKADVGGSTPSAPTLVRGHGSHHNRDRQAAHPTSIPLLSSSAWSSTPRNQDPKRSAADGQLPPCLRVQPQGEPRVRVAETGLRRLQVDAVRHQRGRVRPTQVMEPQAHIAHAVAARDLDELAEPGRDARWMPHPSEPVRVISGPRPEPQTRTCQCPRR